MTKKIAYIKLGSLLILFIISLFHLIRYDDPFLFRCFLLIVVIGMSISIWKELVYKLERTDNELRVPTNWERTKYYMALGNGFLTLLGILYYFMDWGGREHFPLMQIMIPGLVFFSGMLKVPGCQIKVSETELMVAGEIIKLSDIVSIEIRKDSLIVERKYQEPIVKKDLKLTNEWPTTIKQFIDRYLPGVPVLTTGKSLNEA